ncbi:unnamed protein product, partial [Prorocentrum cordatum]
RAAPSSSEGRPSSSGSTSGSGTRATTSASPRANLESRSGCYHTPSRATGRPTTTAPTPPSSSSTSSNRWSIASGAMQVGAPTAKSSSVEAPTSTSLVARWRSTPSMASPTRESSTYARWLVRSGRGGGCRRRGTTPAPSAQGAAKRRSLPRTAPGYASATTATRSTTSMTPCY